MAPFVARIAVIDSAKNITRELWEKKLLKWDSWYGDDWNESPRRGLWVLIRSLQEEGFDSPYLKWLPKDELEALIGKSVRSAPVKIQTFK